MHKSGETESPHQHSDSGLVRELSLWQATATNVVTIIGSAVFVTLPMVLTAMGGPQALIAWVLGMLISICDGLVWAELGAALPGSGGTYVYLQEAFGRDRTGRLMSFLFLWSAILGFPLIVAFCAVTFSRYAQLLDGNERDAGEDSCRDDLSDCDVIALSRHQINRTACDDNLGCRDGRSGLGRNSRLTAL